MKCPACNRKKGIRSIPGYPRIYECPKCKAFFGTCCRGDSYLFVSLWFDAAEEFDQFDRNIREELEAKG